MENLNLNAQIRNTEEKNKEIRAAKMIPAVVYGKNQEPIAIKVDYSEFLKLFRVSGESHIINIKIEKKSIEVLVHDIQKTPVQGEFQHIDFFAITKGEKVHTKIHLHFTGTSKAVKEGAILEEHIKEVEVKVLPKDLIDSFDVDLSKLEEMGDVIRISDLNISSKFEVLNHSDDIVATAAKPAKVEVETPVVTEEETKAETK
ncbi:MAG: 50S ribosomal protein L25 [Candidatus Gracilibacteria bacterium]|nr:50S ribosomal protein L25 [Candidatus Gracilibacteria bacterium]